MRYLCRRRELGEALGEGPEIFLVSAHLFHERLTDRAPEQDICCHHRVWVGFTGQLVMNGVFSQVLS